VYFSSTSTELQTLLTPAVRQQLRADHEVAAALCVKLGLPSCKELREATLVRWSDKGLSADDLATLGLLGSVLPALRKLSARRNLRLSRSRRRAAAGGGAERGRAAGRDPHFDIDNMHVGEAGASALAAALDRGALPRLTDLFLSNAGRRRPSADARADGDIS